MKIKNGDIEDFATFLLSFKLKGTENRMRNRLVRKLQEHLNVIQDEHKDLLDEYCKKDEEGNFQTTIKDGKKIYDIDDVLSFQSEFQKLMNEEFILLNDESNEQMFSTVKDIVLNCDKEFSGKEALEYEIYCEILEENEATII
jgi:hypothetical protein